MSLPTDAAARKAVPIATGVIDYFPAALAAIAALSLKANDQHNPGEPLHWARSKSADEADALMRHFIQRGKIDSDGIRHSTKVAWRALALLQKELEAEEFAPLPRGTKPPHKCELACDWFGCGEWADEDASPDPASRLVHAMRQYKTIISPETGDSAEVEVFGECGNCGAPMKGREVLPTTACDED